MKDANPSPEDPCIVRAAMRRIPLLFGLLALFALTACGNDSNAISDPAGETTLGAVKASTGEGGHALEATGKGREGDTVTVRIADNGVVIGTTMVADDGTWSVTVSGLRDVPCLIDVEVGDVRGDARVSGACNDDEEGDRPTLRIDEAEWDDGEELKVEGYAAPEAEVSIRDADSGSVLGSVRANDEGEWKLERDLDRAPCRVSASADGVTVSAAVEDAPDDCGGTDPGIPLVIDEAKWDVGDGELKVKGLAGPDAEVIVTSAASGSEIGRDSADDEGKWEVKKSLDSVPCRVIARSGDEQVEMAVENAPADCDDAGTPPTDPPTDPPTQPPTPISGDFRVLAANDLGMHCADLDYQIFSILPPFNVVHAQVVQRGVNGNKPRLLGGDEADVVYFATSNPRDPVGSDSINTTSQNQPGIFKSNFWEKRGERTLGGLAYESLYPSTDKLGLCDPANGPCPSALTLFEPIPADLGIPVPDPAQLPSLITGQQAMPSATSHEPFQTAPYAANESQYFDRYDSDLPFFAGFPFGTVVKNASWWAADGIPMSPVDDSGRSNAYPLMTVRAVQKGSAPSDPGNHMAELDVVLPVASEADCQNCHADPNDFGNGMATEFASVTSYADGMPWSIETTATAPGPQPLLNAAKLNILRLHDAKHGPDYTSSADGSSTPCNTGTEASCLANRTPVQCSQCHYSPALDLAQVGPIDEPEQGEFGRQQTRHISMSRAMHGFHGRFSDLFPAMPAPDDPNRTQTLVNEVLNETCYQCHPGKATQCLRGAMFNGGVVCQDCHGNMNQVGNDFTRDLPNGGGLDLAKRVPWVSEPKCQSCHVGDTLTIAAIDTSDFVMASDGLRLAQAYRRSDATKAVLPVIEMPNSRFAENDVLYRLSKGHGGVMCKGCHGSTHAIWPVQPDDLDGPFMANDNLAAVDLQGHAGTITECTVCHEAGSLGLTLDGPHGMHPVNDRRWNKDHEDVAEGNKDACRACHGRNGEGSVLSRVATDRTLETDDNGSIFLPRGTPVRCDICHENEL